MNSGVSAICKEDVEVDCENKAVYRVATD